MEKTLVLRSLYQPQKFLLRKDINRSQLFSLLQFRAGILTHHLAFDAPAWSFLDALLARTRAHRAAQWLRAGPIFAAAAAVTCGRSA